MKINIQKKIGKSTLLFQIEEDKEFDALSRAAIYAGAPDQCGLCQSENVELDSNRAKGFTFVKINCLKCNGRSQLGQYKEGGYFWKNWEQYQKLAEKPKSEKAKVDEVVDEVFPEDIPDYDESAQA